MKKSFLRVWLIALIVGALGGGGAVAAQAASQTGSWSSFLSNKYEGRATVYDHPSAVSASQHKAGNNVPTSWLGARPMLYRAGTLCRGGTWSYNSGAANYTSKQLSGDCGTGSYTARGSARGWNESVSNYAENQNLSTLGVTHN